MSRQRNWIARSKHAGRRSNFVRDPGSARAGREVPLAHGGKMILLYGVAIEDALKDPKTTLASLRSLQKRGQQTLKSQGDFKDGLKKLDRAIKADGKKKYFSQFGPRGLAKAR